MTGASEERALGPQRVDVKSGFVSLVGRPNAASLLS